MFDFSLIISLLISLGSGVISGFLTREETSVFFDTIVKAPLTPPAFVFPIVWTALYALMGYSAWLVWKGKCNEKRISLFIYSLQLVFVFLWPIIFFVYKQFEISFFWIILLWLMIIAMVIFGVVAAGASFADKIANAPMITDSCFFINNLLLDKIIS